MREALASLRQLAQQLPPGFAEFGLIEQPLRPPGFAEFGLIEQPLRRSAAIPGVSGGATPTGVPGVGGGATLGGTPSGVSRGASPALSFTPSLSGSASPPVLMPSTARRFDASPPSEGAVAGAAAGAAAGATASPFASGTGAVPGAAPPRGSPEGAVVGAGAVPGAVPGAAALAPTPSPGAVKDEADGAQHGALSARYHSPPVLPKTALPKTAPHGINGGYGGSGGSGGGGGFGGFGGSGIDGEATAAGAAAGATAGIATGIAGESAGRSAGAQCGAILLFGASVEKYAKAKGISPTQRPGIDSSTVVVVGHRAIICGRRTPRSMSDAQCHFLAPVCSAPAWSVWSAS